MEVLDVVPVGVDGASIRLLELELLVEVAADTVLVAKVRPAGVLPAWQARPAVRLRVRAVGAAAAK